MYCAKIESYLEELVENGCVKLPSIENAIWRDKLFADCLSEIGSKSYGENLDANLKFLIDTHILSDLMPRLAELADAKLGFSVDKSDIYNVCRVVRPGDKSEGYRGHFDSHLFTLVTPINIPVMGPQNDAGQLHYFPHARKQPRTEIANIFGKAFYKKYNSPQGFYELSKKTERKIEDFQDYRPLLFLGNTTYHGNAPVDANSSTPRMTILTHFFDPSPKYGVGNLLRKIRNR